MKDRGRVVNWQKEKWLLVLLNKGVWVYLPLVRGPGILNVDIDLVVGLLVRSVILGDGNKNAGSRALGKARSSQVVLAGDINVSDALVFAQNGQVGDDIDGADVSGDDANSVAIQAGLKRSSKAK